MDASKLQQVIDAENERLNEISEQKALVRVREIASLKKRKAEIDAEIAKLQKEIDELPWDSVTAADIIGAAATE